MHNLYLWEAPCALYGLCVVCVGGWDGSTDGGVISRFVYGSDWNEGCDEEGDGLIRHQDIRMLIL